jgi:hypothetical protein
MFQTQLRAILRASKHGPIKLLIPMLAHAHEIDQTLAALEQAKVQPARRKGCFDENIQVGGMIEIPAAALAVGLFLRRLDFLSIGTNDLIQYTLAIDRSDEQVSSLYDPLHPAVLMLLAHTMASAEKVGIPVSVCGEMAGDPKLTRLLLGMGLRIFSMHPSQILEVKSRVLKANVEVLAPNVRRMLRLDEPASCGSAGKAERLRGQLQASTGLRFRQKPATCRSRLGISFVECGNLPHSRNARNPRKISPRLNTKNRECFMGYRIHPLVAAMAVAFSGAAFAQANPQVMDAVSASPPSVKPRCQTVPAR